MRAIWTIALALAAGPGFAQRKTQLDLLGNLNFPSPGTFSGNARFGFRTEAWFRADRPFQVKAAAGYQRFTGSIPCEFGPQGDCLPNSFEMVSVEAGPAFEFLPRLRASALMGWSRLRQKERASQRGLVSLALDGSPDKKERLRIGVQSTLLPAGNHHFWSLKLGARIL